MSKKTPLYILITTNIIIIILLSVMVFNYLFLGKTKKVSSSGFTVENTKSTTNYTAEEIINKMKEKSSNIGKVVVYTEETDSNKLLGRPNQYTSKIQFADNRVDQSHVEENDAIGGTIEVFNSKEDMEKRKNHIETISSSASFFTQYIYAKDYAILRLESDITPEQAKEYENLFYEVIK